MNAETDKDLNPTTDDTPGVSDPQDLEVMPEAQADAPDTNGGVTDPEEDVQQQLTQMQAQLDDYVDRLKRAQADFQNYKKRKEKEQAEVFVMTEDHLLKEFLPLYDDFQRAFEAFESNGDHEALIEGMKLIFAKFQDFVESKEIGTLDVVGVKFDPALHEVLMTVESDGDPHIVLDEFERGYTRQGRLLRPSRVTVSKPAAHDDSEHSVKE